jgi:fluoroquinolone transport system ATP-binding protein
MNSDAIPSLKSAVIHMRAFGYVYEGSSKPAVEELSFNVARGEIFGFLGPSGAGKSTTQNVLIGLLSGYQGTIEVLGRDLRHWDRNYYQRIGVAFEAPNHYLKLTARENLRLFAALYDAETEDPDRVLDRVGLGQDANKRVAEFSKGMRGRLTLARALQHRPELLFLDEPTAGLDPSTARQIRQVIEGARANGATIFLTTHDMVTAQELCDRVAFLNEGRITAIDSPQALRRSYGRRALRVEMVRDGVREAREFDLERLGENQSFLAWIGAGTVESMHTLETTLEDVFVQVTGRKLA